MFKLGIIGIILTHAIFATGPSPEYEIHVWDKLHGGLNVKGVNCSQDIKPCFWYRDVHGVATRVSNNTTLCLTPESEYDEYYLLEDQSQSVVQYALVIPSSNAGKVMNNFMVL